VWPCEASGWCFPMVPVPGPGEYGSLFGNVRGEFWLEHIRQHARAIVADRELEAKLRDCLANIPSVRHLLYL